AASLAVPRRAPRPPLFPYTTLFRSVPAVADHERPLADRGREAVHLDRVARAGAEIVERDAHLPRPGDRLPLGAGDLAQLAQHPRSEEHTSELQSRFDLVCRLLLEKK